MDDNAIAQPDWDDNEEARSQADAAERGAYVPDDPIEAFVEAFVEGRTLGEQLLMLRSVQLGQVLRLTYDEGYAEHASAKPVRVTKVYDEMSFDVEFIQDDEDFGAWTVYANDVIDGLLRVEVLQS